MRVNSRSLSVAVMMALCFWAAVARGQAAAPDDPHAVAEVLDLGELVGRYEDRPAFVTGLLAEALELELDERVQLKWAETFADGSFAPAKKGGSASERPNAERVRSGWWWQTAKEFLWGTTWTLRPRRKSR